MESKQAGLYNVAVYDVVSLLLRLGISDALLIIMMITSR